MTNPVPKSPACRIRNALLIALALAACAFLAYCLWSDPTSFIPICFVFLVPPGVLFGALLWLGRFLKHTGRRGGRLIASVAWTGLALAAAFFGYFIWISGPWFNGIIAHDTSPDGREYVLSQAWLDWFDEYDLRIFQRQEDGQWLSHWGGSFWHPQNRNRLAEVLLDGQDHLPEIRLIDDGKRHFQRNKQSIHPAHLSPADLHALHLDEMRDRRSLPPVCEIATDAHPSTPQPTNN